MSQVYTGLKCGDQRGAVFIPLELIKDHLNSEGLLTGAGFPVNVPGALSVPRVFVLFCFDTFPKGWVMAADKLLGAISVAFYSRNGPPRPLLRCFWVKMKQNSMEFNSIDLCIFTDFYSKKDLFFLSSAEQKVSPQGGHRP